eukprot:CAMPEP_0201600136 /NCGR_PEP_ID=MMETSP0492-20130828/1325_1 /ASSEMBLY_ACC=CAM_ASM_000837 /TAXON_ID=420259 /ORGANISM="Thalassiosira gravida, Strain GMp14c1" /LENGTH=346 /DNA_ID=CAMNT_0048062847 /DNA_START=151 /DNA_END=1191 /DNA_ORIENTATION=-
MSSSITGNLVTIQQAIEIHKKSNNDDNNDECGSKNVFIDGSWHMPPRVARTEFALGPRIPNARFLDIDDLGPPPGHPANPNKSKNLPHMKPTPETFARAMDRMSITPNDMLYVYTATKNCIGYHRAYWTLSNCGYHDPEKVKLVQGCLDEWRECGGEIEHGELTEGEDDRLFRTNHDDDDDDASAKYTCWRKDGGDSVVVDMERVLTVVENNKAGSAADAIVVDARSSGRFFGTEPEPRPGLRGGHAPGAVNVPFFTLLDPNDMAKFRPMEEVRDIFVEAGIAPLSEEGGGAPRKVICSCGSGVTAAALVVALEECGLRTKEDISIYDGSWIDWGGDDDTPIVTTD